MDNNTGASAKKIWDSIVNVIIQLHATMPDSILFGSIILYLVTLSKVYGVFALFIIELIASHKFLSWLIKGTVGPSSGPQNVQCMSGYKLARLNYTQIIPTHQSPSYGIFSITAIATYLGLSTYEFYDVMQTMGQQWQYRAAVAGVFMFATVLLCIIVRLINCDSFGDIAISCVFALICGSLFFYINKLLFDKEGVNFLGLPTIESKDVAGKNIYICKVSN
jgi:hypothetical protein